MDNERSTTDERDAEIVDGHPSRSRTDHPRAHAGELRRERRVGDALHGDPARGDAVHGDAARGDAARGDRRSSRRSSTARKADAEVLDRARFEGLVEDFLAEHTAATAACYRRDLRHIAEYLDACGTDLLRARRGELARYVRDSELSTTARATISRRIAALSSFYTYLVDQGELDHSPVAGLRRPHGRHAPRLGISAEEIARVLEVARADSKEMELLVFLLAICGLRISEALGIDDTDLCRTSDAMAVVVRRKGERSDLVGLPRDVGERLEAVRATQPPGPVFRGPRGGRLSRQVAWRELRDIGERAGIRPGLHAHLLRHSFISCALLYGVPVPIVAAGAGHRDPQTCLGYAQALEALSARAANVVAQVVADADARSG